MFGLELGNNGAAGQIFQINGLAESSPTHPVPAIAGLFSDLVAWQQDPGSVGPPEIRIRYEPKASTLGPEQVVSSPGQGPTNAALGLAAGGDAGGDAAIAWVQGTGASAQIVAEQLYQPPGSAAPAKSLLYTRTAQPVLSWSPSGARWGPITYTVSLDGTSLGSTGATSIQVPAALPDGPHSWSVIAGNPAGLSSGTRTARVFVDTVAPRLTARVGGARLAGSRLILQLSYRDVRPASGAAKLTVRWGDGRVERPKTGVQRLTHTYLRPGRYRVTIVIVDRAGNQSTLVKRLQIKKRPPAHTPGGKRP